MLGVRHLVDSFVKNNCTGSMKYDKSSLLNVIGISYNAPFPLNAEKAQKIKNNEQPMSFDGWGKPLNTCGGRSISDLLNVIAQRGDEFGSRRYEQHLKFKKEEAENNEREAKAREERRAAAIAAENEEKRKNEARIKEEKRIFEENAAKRKVDLRAGKVEPIDIYELSYKYDAPIDITIVTNPPLTADQKNYVVAGYLEKVEEKLLGGKVMFFRFNTDMGVRYSQAEIDSKTIIKTPLRMNGDYAVAGKFIGVTKRTLNTGLEITIPRFQALYIME
jgi:hypothetical protein